MVANGEKTVMSSSPSSKKLPLDDDARKAVLAALADLKHLDGALLPILHQVQKRLGFVPPAAIPVIAEALNVTRAEVHGVVSFYHDFRDHPPGRHILKICRAEACQARDGAHMAAIITSLLGADFGETSADELVTVEPVYCLGLCAVAPAAMLDDEPIGRLDPARIRALVGEITQ